MKSWLKLSTLNSCNGETYCVKSHRPPNESDLIARYLWKLENRKESEWTKKSDYDSISRKRTRLQIPRGPYTNKVSSRRKFWLRRDNEIIQMRLIRQRILWTYPVCAMRSDAADVDIVH